MVVVIVTDIWALHCVLALKKRRWREAGEVWKKKEYNRIE